MNSDVQIARAKDADVIMIANMPLKGEVIRALQEFKVYQYCIHWRGSR